MTGTANVDLTPKIATGNPLTVTIPAGGAVPIAWNLTAPENQNAVSWHVTARSQDGKAPDQVTVAQSIQPVWPVEVWAGTLARVGAGTSLAIAPAGVRAIMAVSNTHQTLPT